VVAPHLIVEIVFDGFSSASIVAWTAPTTKYAPKLAKFHYLIFAQIGLQIIQI
jgi:hypothetical protein